MQRGPWWGPEPRPGRMQPLAARELSRAPAPAPAGPGLRSRSHRPAPERHDFQAAFRLDSLQVRGRRPPLLFNSGGAAHHPLTLRTWGRVQGTRPGAGRKHRAGAPIPSFSSPTPGAWVGGSGPSHPNFGGRGGLTPLSPLSLSTAGVAGRGQCSRLAWALKLGLAASCGHPGRERTLP